MKGSYDSTKAGEFWSKRLNSTDPLSAVLTFGAPKALNQLYDFWETENLVSALPNNIKGKKALDIGCGTGRITLTLARLGAQVTAIDVSESMLNHLEKTAQKEKVQKRIRILRSSSASIPIENNHFDIATCFGLLEHLPDEVRRKTILEAFRVLKPKGKLFVVVNNDNCIFLKNSYPMKAQREDGYFVSLVGYRWLNSLCREKGKKMKAIGSNPMYGLLQYYVSGKRKEKFGSEKDFNQFVSKAGNFDIEVTNSNDNLSTISSHLLVEIRQK